MKLKRATKRQKMMILAWASADRRKSNHKYKRKTLKELLAEFDLRK